MQKASNQLRSNIANATRNRGDKVNSTLFCNFFKLRSWTKLKIVGRPTHIKWCFHCSFAWVRCCRSESCLCFCSCSCLFLQNAIHNHIRLFEPLVIKALKQYTTSTSVALQRQVLDLLAQLVQLRVNYCLLDSDQVKETKRTRRALSWCHLQRVVSSLRKIFSMFQVFIGFVLKQFEFIEVGQFR